MNTGQLSVFQLPCIHLAPKPEACRHFIFLQNTGKHLLRHTLKIIDSPMNNSHVYHIDKVPFFFCSILLLSYFLSLSIYDGHDCFMLLY